MKPFEPFTVEELRAILNDEHVFAREERLARQLLAMLDQGLRPPPARAAPGILELGVSPDEREVVMNLPYTPDNGSGFVHYTFTPSQAMNMGALFFKKAKDCKKVGMAAFGAREEQKP